MSSYSEDDIRRAAEIREWLVKQISDKQEEIEKLRITLSLVDSLLKQGSFRAAASLTQAQYSGSSIPSASASVQQAQVNPTEIIAASGSLHESAQRSEARPTAIPTAVRTSHVQKPDGLREEETRTLKRAKDDFVLAQARVSADTVEIIPSTGTPLNANTPPFRSFFVSRILEGMKARDAGKVAQGVLKQDEALNYQVEEQEGGLIERVTIRNYRERERLGEIFNTSTWVFTRMLEKGGN